MLWFSCDARGHIVYMLSLFPIFGLRMFFFPHLHTAVITITITTQRERILLVELLHAEYAHAYSTNFKRSCFHSCVAACVTGPLALMLCLSPYSMHQPVPPPTLLPDYNTCLCSSSASATDCILLFTLPFNPNASIYNTSKTNVYCLVF